MSDFDPLVFEFEYRAKHRDARLDGRLLAFIPECGRLLDAGCGAGRLTVRMAEHAGTVYGLDISEKMLALARTREVESNRRNIRWVRGSIETIPFGPSVFDAVVSSNVLQFVDIELAFPEFKRVLKRGGKLTLDNWTLDSWKRTSAIFLLRRLLITREVWGTCGLPTAFEFILATVNRPRSLDGSKWRPLTPSAFREGATRFFPGAVFQHTSKRMIMFWENS